MRTFFRVVAPSLLLAMGAVAAPEVPDTGLLEGRIVTTEALAPIEGATIVVTDELGGPVVASGITAADGWFHYRLPRGRYQILAMFAETRWIHHGIEVTRGKTTQVAGVLAVDPSEVITVHDKVTREHRPANAIWASVKPMLPYSDKVMDENVWAVGWMLLDVSEVGQVTAFRFLHRPGHDLEAIAEREVWNLRFEPARDDAGTALASKVLWKFEWPPFHWVKDHKLKGLGGENALTPQSHIQAMHDKVSDGQLMMGETLYDTEHSFMLPDGVHKPPCRGQAPYNLDNHEPVYRDCTPPDLSLVNSERLITRPGTDAGGPAVTR